MYAGQLAVIDGYSSQAIQDWVFDSPWMSCGLVCFLSSPK